MTWSLGVGCLAFIVAAILKSTTVSIADAMSLHFHSCFVTCDPTGQMPILEHVYVFSMVILFFIMCLCIYVYMNAGAHVRIRCS